MEGGESFCKFFSTFFFLTSFNFSIPKIIRTFAITKFEKMKVYQIVNEDYHTKRVLAENMEQALHKYRKYLDTAIYADYSAEDVFTKVKSCEYQGEYVEDYDLIK